MCVCIYLVIAAYLYEDEAVRQSEDTGEKPVSDNQTRVAGEEPASDNQTRVAGEEPANDNQTHVAAAGAASDSPNETDVTEAYELQPVTDNDVSLQGQSLIGLTN